MKYLLVIFSVYLLSGCGDLDGFTQTPQNCVSMVFVKETDIERFTKRYICEETTNEIICSNYKFNESGVCEVLYVRSRKK